MGGGYGDRGGLEELGVKDDCDQDTMQFSKNLYKRSIKKNKNLPYQTKLLKVQ